MTRTIDDLVGPRANQLENITESFRILYNHLKTTVNYGLLTGANLISYSISGLAGPVTAGAMMLGKALLNFKKGMKTEWSKLYKEGWKGLLLGNLAKIFYQNIINAIPNKNICGKICRALAYNPGFMGGIYNPVYLKSTQLLENKVTQKDEWQTLTKRIFKYNFIPHFLTTNYLRNVQQQVASSAFLGTAYRVLAG